MRVLYNGTYQEYNICENNNCGQIFESIECNKKWLNQQIGDFVVMSTEYDWGLLQQVNTVRCVRCGFERPVANLAAFIRGKGEGRLCKCRYKKEEKQPKVNYSDYVGQTVNGFQLLAYKIDRGFRVECIDCGKQKWANGKSVLGGTVECNHQVAAVYDESIIGNRYGHLTVVEKVGKFFKFRCDCGFEKVLRPTGVCRGMITTCGRPECEYHREKGFDLAKVKASKEGFAFEKKLTTFFEKAGYRATQLPDTGDFGVDVIVEIAGEKWAFQCKKKKMPAGVSAVTEVYGGGRFHDCTRFCVVSPSGFTYQAKQIAAKLGVQLETKTFRFGVTQEQNATELLRVEPVAVSEKRVLWSLNGVTKPPVEWCSEFGISITTVKNRVASGMSLEAALKTPKYPGSRKYELLQINGEEKKTLAEWCEKYGVI